MHGVVADWWRKSPRQWILTAEGVTKRSRAAVTQAFLLHAWESRKTACL